MPPSKIDPVVWHMVVHGADGLIYFCHDFWASDSSPGMVEDGCLNDAGMPAAMTATNAAVQKYANVLQTPDLQGTTATSTGLLPTTLTKSSGGQKYVFAIGEGNSSNTQGQAVDATITVSGAGSGTVDVLDEGRTVQMTNGQFSDHFAPYEHHIYRLP